MRIKEIKKLIIFGGSYILSEFAVYIAKNSSLDLVVFSSERHLNGISSIEGKTLKEVLAKNKIRYFNSDDINSDKNLKSEIAGNVLGIAFGAVWIFNKETADLFPKNQLLDFMGIDLPRYRGGAHYTWQILHGNRKGCANLQIIHGGLITFNKGEIFKRRDFKLPAQLQKPKDYFDFIGKQEIDFLKDFLSEVKKGKEFKLKNLKEEHSSYYPFLNTKINGFVDWSWVGRDIFLFINAFDDPYDGASTFLGQERVALKDVELLKAEEKYHPFSSGLVIRKNDGGIFVATIGNLLYIKKVLDKENKNIINKIELGDRLLTPNKFLEEARNSKIIYSPRGSQKI